MGSEKEALGITQTDVRRIARSERKAYVIYLIGGAATTILSFFLGKITYDALGRPFDTTYPFAVALVSTPTRNARKLAFLLIIVVISAGAFLIGVKTEVTSSPMEGTYYGVSAVEDSSHVVLRRTEP